MNQTNIDPTFQILSVEHSRAVVKNAAGQVIFDSAVGHAWQGYIVRKIIECLDGNNNTPSLYREMTGTYEIVLAGAGDVNYFLNNNQDLLQPLCMMQKPNENSKIELAPKELRCLCYNDNEITFIN